MGDRWITVVLEEEPQGPRRPRSPGTSPIPAAPSGRHPIWAAVIGALLACGIAAALVGAWLTAASASRWNEITLDAAETGADLAERTRNAATALTDELAGLQSTTVTLGEVSISLEAAARIAADLERVAGTGLPPGPDAVDALVREIDRLAGAIDLAFPGLAELGIADPDGPGDALRAVAAALMTVSDALAEGPVTGFGPFVLRYPLPGYTVITDPFGTARGDGFHRGIDIGAPAGTPILAAAEGVVLQAGWLDDGAGNGVILRHSQGWETRYFHMISPDLPVAAGDEVAAGEVIGHVGSTGESTGPHLHFEIVFGPIRMDPENGFTYIGREALSGSPPPGALPGLPDDPAPIGEPLTVPGTEAPRTTALAEARADIADIQQELQDIGTEASNRASALQVRRIEERDRAQTASLVLYAGAMAVGLGLLLMWLTRRRRPAPVG